MWQAAGSRISIDLVLDGKEQIGRALHLVDDEEAAVADEEGRICQRGRTDRCLIEKPQLRAGEVCHNQPGKGALARLPRSVDDYHAGVGQGGGDGRLRMTRDEACRLHLASLLRLWLICRELCG